ncbi:MAG: diphthine synthase [archaeon]
MTLNLISLGMNANSLTAEALDAIKSSDKIYLENYTVNFPYKIKDLKIKVTELSREQIENESILKEAKTKTISLLVYGDALSATTHIHLILAAKKQNIPYKIFHNASILTTVAETGLSLYKFGKTTSMPNWAEHTNKPKSFADYIAQNQSINAHTLLLIDIGLKIKDAINQLKQSAKNLPEKIVLLSNAGTQNQKIFYDTPKNLTTTYPLPSTPYCLIIPAELHFLEEKALNEFKTNLNH